MYLGAAREGMLNIGARSSDSGGRSVGAPIGAKTFFIPPTSRCPAGYSSIREGFGTSRVIRCVPKAQPVYRAPPPAPVAAPVFKPTVTVTPSFQQQFTPQFSPTMQQQQDSPGAQQAAQPSQKVSTPQTVTPPPSGENEATKALKEELERLKMQNLIRELTAPIVAPEIATPDTQIPSTGISEPLPPAPIPQDTTGLPIPVGIPTYAPVKTYSEVPGGETGTENKINPWLIGGGVLAAALLMA